MNLPDWVRLKPGLFLKFSPLAKASGKFAKASGKFAKANGKLAEARVM
jgi:hypothetical protein